jgi:acyl-CoA synthetase (AMP-forming)/AMP-acid ligase II
VCGRIKDLIIVRGRNHYPQDIERTAERAAPELRAVRIVGLFPAAAGVHGALDPNRCRRSTSQMAIQCSLIITR